ncbi:MULTISPECIES: hypothetical protein [Streptomyces]|uniref:Uncharacterized protein n=1 Tax=Streptomyces pseudogriseolus TaxID=36817 RepID=A0ABQ2TL13_STREZ|nr:MULTISPECIES: hypothetical protein [Streptomyces]AXI91246.1 hypothetical protein SAM9427_36355 [Streptomyces sp. ETH9427]GGS76027.1 hypothetical protein GCM10010285_63190 [Streptomyces rubiginosus]
MSKDIATRVTTGVQALALPGQREGWQAQHRGSLLTDAQTYDALADAIQADLKARRLDGDLPWGISAAARARKRVKPLRDAARAMRQAAKAINGTVAAYEETQPEVVLQRREEKALRKAQRKQQLGAVAHNSAQATLQRLAPADSDDGQAGAPKLLGDYFGGNSRQQRGA